MTRDLTLTGGRLLCGAALLLLSLLAACAPEGDTQVASGSTVGPGDGQIPSEIMWNAAVAPPNRTFVLDGRLDEWSDADRLDAEPGMGVPGYALLGHHDAANGKFHVAIFASGGIGPQTTFWLNTDRNTATGHQVWGSGVGAEFNINVAQDGAPHLYTGADGEVWIAGPISHAYNADHTVLELEFTQAMVSSDTPIDMWVDVNNTAFLPRWYGLGGYTIDAVGVPQPPEAPQGAIVLDGALDDWELTDRLDRMPGTGVLGYEVYGRADAESYYFALRALPPAVGFGPGTTLWLNTDRDRATGHQVWGIAVGAEYNINVAADGTPHLYSGAAAESWIVGPLPHGTSAGGDVLEIALPRSFVSPAATSIDVSVDVNDTVFLPADFTGPGYTLFHPDDLPAPAGDDRVRVAMIYSATSEAKYFGDKAYSQLYAAMQHQAMMAGVPFSLLHEEALTDIDQIKDFDVLFIPYMANVSPSSLQAIEDTLTKAVYHYDIGIITAGNFLTNDPQGGALPGDSYARMKHLLGVTLQASEGPTDFCLEAGSEHPILRGYAPGEILADYTGSHVQYFARHHSVAWPFATLTSDGGQSHPAAWAVTTGARSVHFASTAAMGDTDLAWRAVLWSIYGERPWVGLQPTRQRALFVPRCDMDQSQYADEAPILYEALPPIVKKWKDDFNFVGSYYVNLGNDKANAEYTDWSVSGPVYQQLMDLGGEIGTHSYTHPDNTSQLSDAALEFEFKTARDVLSAHIGVPVLGAAVPGNPETMNVDVALDGWFSYATADYSGFLAGYHGAMGLLSPDFSMVYLAPNMFFDFTLIGFWGLDATAALEIWKQQLDGLLVHASSPLVVWPWHDYGPTGFEGPEYTAQMYRGLLAYARDAGVEFVTAAEAARRVAGYRHNALSVKALDADTLQVDVLGGPEVGRQALRLELPSGRHIASVDDWPAFTDDRVLTGEGERTYVVRLSSGPPALPRLLALPMRASLMQVQADPLGLRFRFSGAGRVEVALPPTATGIKVDAGVIEAFADGALTLDFAGEGTHDCQITFVL